MHRNSIIAVCVLFCVIAVGAGLAISRLSRASVIAMTPASSTASGTTAAATAAPPTALTQATSLSATVAPTASPIATAAPAITAPAATAAATATPSPAAGAPAYIEYTIAKGDILYNIAEKYGVTVEEIVAINKIAKPESLVVGQVIRIPNK